MYNKRILSCIGEWLLTHHQNIAVAESVTAGHLQAALSLADNASKFFQGGITAYNVGQKARLLEVEPIHALSCNCVSEKIARQMAARACRLFTSDWGISVTGYAAPVPECDIYDLHAYYAIAFRGKIVRTQKTMTKKNDPLEVQEQYVVTILKDFLNFLETHPKYKKAKNFEA